MITDFSQKGQDIVLKKYTRKEISDIYEDYCENDEELVGEEVYDAIRNYNGAFDDYIAAVSEDGFSRGFRHALRLMERGDISGV